MLTKNSIALSLLLAKRLLTAGENRFARFVTWVSFIGLTLGVLILTVVVTVMNGFDNELKTRLLSSVPHLTIQFQDSVATPAAMQSQFNAAKGRVQLDKKLGEDLGKLMSSLVPDQQVQIHPYFQGVSALSVNGRVQPIGLYGVERSGASSIEHIGKAMRGGRFEDFYEQDNAILISQPIARHLGLLVGDSVVVLAVGSHRESVRPRLLRFELTGTFQLDAEIDYSLAIVNLSFLEPMTWREIGEYGTQIQFADPLSAPQLVPLVTKGLQSAISAEDRDNANIEVRVNSWAQTYGALFQAVQLEKSMMFVLLVLVVAIAGFNIIAGQTMMVNDKRSSIAILRTMGASGNLILRVFLFQGVLISVLGTLLGLLLGILCAKNINTILDGVQAITGMHLLDGSFFVEVPTKVEAFDLLFIAGVSISLCLLAALSPARKAAQLDPISALHL